MPYEIFFNNNSQKHIMQKKIIITKDGSPTIFIDEYNETYHSRNGALTESNHIYINRGLGFWLESTRNKHVKIFEDRKSVV